MKEEDKRKKGNTNMNAVENEVGKKRKVEKGNGRGDGEGEEKEKGMEGDEGEEYGRRRWMKAGGDAENERV